MFFELLPTLPTLTWQELVRDIVVTVNGSEVDVVHEEVTFAKSLIMSMWDEVSSRASLSKS